MGPNVQEVGRKLRPKLAHPREKEDIEHCHGRAVQKGMPAAVIPLLLPQQDPQAVHATCGIRIIGPAIQRTHSKDSTLHIFE